MARRENMTQEAIDAAVRLKAVWDIKKKQLNLTQSEFGRKYGMSQGLVTHYLNGHQGLNMKTVVMFASELKVDPRDIYPELFTGLQLCPISPDDEFMHLYSLCPAEGRALVKDIMRQLVGSKPPEELPEQ